MLKPAKAMLLILSINSIIFAQTDTLFRRPIQQGYNSKLWMSAQGLAGFAAAPTPDQTLGFEYPLNSFVNHCSEIQMWVGAIADTSSVGIPRYGYVVQANGLSDILVGNGLRSISDFYPVDTARPWFRTSRYYSNEPNRRGYDDDNDGFIDEDDLDGFDNDSDGMIDEDYGAVSEGDYYCAYVDTIRWYHVRDPESRPMGVKVWQKSFSWARDVREPIIPIEYNIINVSKKPLREVYIGFLLGSYIGPLESPGYFFNNIGGYWPELRTIWFHNPADRGSTPFGYSILDYPGAQEGLKFRYRWNAPNDPLPTTDREYYSWLNGSVFSGEPLLRPDRDRSTLSFISAFLSFGPVDTLFPGDTMRVTLAVVGSTRLESGQDNLYDNASKAQTLFARDYYPPVVLGSPRLEITPGGGMVHLSWGPSSDQSDPRSYWDEKSGLSKVYPIDHWRRQNPPPGITTGGRIFEGFRLYRSEDPAGIGNSFTLIRQWDMIDSVGPKYEYDTGLDTEYTDPGLVTGKSYWYSLTSFGIPDLYLMKYLDWDETVQEETLQTKSSESSLLNSRKRVRLSFEPSEHLGEVLVVPNPYRVDQSYSFESGGWEGRQRSWREEKRLIRFIHLPPESTIRIYSLAGDIITTLYHNDPIQGEEDWNLLSESGRAIASGLYIFSVESKFGSQVGKFVIIR